MSGPALTERDTVSPSGQYNLSAIMTLAVAKARREADRRAKGGLPRRYRRELADALRSVWSFARATRQVIEAKRIPDPVFADATAARIAGLRTALEMTAFIDDYRIAAHEARRITAEISNLTT